MRRRLPANPDLTRRSLLAAIAAGWVVCTALFLGVAPAPAPTVRVVHWANGHVMDPVLLPAFAARFNSAGYHTRSGSRIEVEPYLVNSGIIRQEVVRRSQTGVPINRSLPDPTVITPAAEHWLYEINRAVARTVIDVPSTRSLVTTWIGIATYREMAECLGWPDQKVGYKDVVALALDPAGWGSRPCARAEWGNEPLLTFTDPNLSSTGRSVLFSLYTLAAGKPAHQLTEGDVLGQPVSEYIRGLQRSVRHYVPDTLILMDEIYSGPRYGHFFFISEDDLVKLYEGKVVGTDPGLERIYGRKKPAGPIERPLVMLYPSEGSTAHTHTAAVVQSSWVTEEQAEAANRWIDYLREDAQQNTFMKDGFRPSTSIALRCPICGQYGVDPREPRAAPIDPTLMDPSVARRIVESWGDVKNAGVMVFVVDTSPSMAGEKLNGARDAIIRAADTMYRRNLVGLITSSPANSEGRAGGERLGPAPIVSNRSELSDTVRRLRTSEGNALYQAVASAVAMADAAPAEPRAIRGVVVLAGSPADAGASLESLVQMVSRAGRPIASCSALGPEGACQDVDDEMVARGDLLGVGLAVQTQHPVAVYFIGIGDRADLEAGRVIAEATASSFIGTTVEDLDTVVKLFSVYF